MKVLYLGFEINFPTWTWLTYIKVIVIVNVEYLFFSVEISPNQGPSAEKCTGIYSAYFFDLFPS